MPTVKITPKAYSVLQAIATKTTNGDLAMAFHNALAAHHDQVCAGPDAERAEHAAENAEKTATFAAMGKDEPAAEKAARKRATSDDASESSSAPTRSPLAIRRWAAAAK